MKIKLIIFYLVLFICFIINCDNKLEYLSTNQELIPYPTKETIAFVAPPEDIHDYPHIRISNHDYTKSYRLTAHFGSMIDWSPNKEWIVYTWLFRIIKMRYDGSNKQQLTPTSMEAQGCRFSPDGNQLVFGAKRSNSDAYDIWIMYQNGLHQRPVTYNELVSPVGDYYFAWPDWSNDGKKIIFKYHRIDTTRLQEHIGILDLITGQLITLSSIDTLQPFQPRWSPKRDEFLSTVLLSVEHGGTDIYLFDINGKKFKRLTDSGKARNPEWHSDGDWFVYEKLVDGEKTIWKMKRDGTENQRIIIGDYKIGSAPAW